MDKNSGFLLFIFLIFTSCATLSPGEMCALIGQVHEGTEIGTQTHIDTIGTQIYSYNTRVYNPICKRPKTEEDKEFVANLLPQAIQKKEQIDRERMMFFGGFFIFFIPLLIMNQVN